MDVSFIYDESDETILATFNELTSEDVLSAINNKFLETLNELRNRRNQLAHENSYPRNMLHKDINNILILMYSLYYYVTTDMDLISIFAWKE